MFFLLVCNMNDLTVRITMRKKTDIQRNFFRHRAVDKIQVSFFTEKVIFIDN